MTTQSIPEENVAVSKQESSQENRGLPLSHVLKSCLWAITGLQTRENHERDFKQGKPMPYMVVGVIFTILFVLAVVYLAQLAISYV